MGKINHIIYKSIFLLPDRKKMYRQTNNILRLIKHPEDGSVIHLQENIKICE